MLRFLGYDLISLFMTNHEEQYGSTTLSEWICDVLSNVFVIYKTKGFTFFYYYLSYFLFLHELEKKVLYLYGLINFQKGLGWINAYLYNKPKIHVI